MNDLARRLRAATHDAVGGAQPPPNLAELVRGPDQRHRARVAVAVPPPGPQRLAWARARAGSAIAERRGPAGRAARSWPRRAARAEPGSRWPGWMPPLAAAAAVAAGMAGAVGASSALHRPGVAPAGGPGWAGYRLRRQRHRAGVGDPDPHRHQHAADADHGEATPGRDRDHPRRQDRLRGQHR